MSPSDLSRADPSESNAQVHARLGGSTGYVPREKTSFGFESPPVWLMKQVGCELRVVASTRPRWWEWAILFMFTAAGAAAIVWLINHPPRIGMKGSVLGIFAVVLGLSGIWFAILWPRVVNASTEPLAVLNLDRREVRWHGSDRTPAVPDLVRLEIVSVAYTFLDRDMWGLQHRHTVYETHLIACVRQSPDRVAWVVIDDRNSPGLSTAAARLSSAMGIANQRVSVNRVKDSG
jgi:hypothetical protein